MSSQDFVKLALQLTAMLAFAVVFGEAMRRFKQPAVVGEMFGGIVLGPTLFGCLRPAFDWLFLSRRTSPWYATPPSSSACCSFCSFAGLEVDLSDLRTLGDEPF